MSLDFSYRHLYYFWVVAKEGGLSRGAERLGVAVQTVSAQVRELEQALGHALLQPAGRGVALTEAGRAAMLQAEQIFQLGAALPDRVRDAATVPVVRLAVGVGGGLPKLVVWRLLRPVLDEPHLRLQIREQDFEPMLADLALHRLDVVLADRAAPPQQGLRLYSHRLGGSPVGWYAPPAWQSVLRDDFPRALARVPVLLPTRSATMRIALDQWFEREALHPQVVGEFDDSAMLKTFGAGGMGVFPAADWVHDDLVARYGVCRVGGSPGVEEPFFAIAADKRIQHPLVQRLWPEPAVDGRAQRVESRTLMSAARSAGGVAWRT